jgi:hypothetical protein
MVEQEYADQMNENKRISTILLNEAEAGMQAYENSPQDFSDRAMRSALSNSASSNKDRDHPPTDGMEDFVPIQDLDLGPNLHQETNYMTVNNASDYLRRTGRKIPVEYIDEVFKILDEVTGKLIHNFFAQAVSHFHPGVGAP